ncbi:Ryanodine Receptor 2 [Manis pentadactyla]|nr:Ryanodine Receptor 2 [Manis pentadactyla]
MSAWGHPQYQQSLEALTAQQDRDHEKALDTVRPEAEVSIMVDAAPETVKEEGGQGEKDPAGGPTEILLKPSAFERLIHSRVLLRIAHQKLSIVSRKDEEKRNYETPQVFSNFK